MGAPRLAPDEFSAFFHAVHGVEPFPWQERLAQLVFERGWPETLAVPTGAGKTAAIDVAVFHLALEANKDSRRAPVRIVFVVDRRIVVDEAYRRAETIASKLEGAPKGVLHRMNERLSLLAEPGRRPLVAVKLRGGTPKEPDWIRTPSQPAVISSTVDQVGSRLFFRGYGVSDSMKPVHAGLLGSDTLFLLDEAHLSQPFVESIRDSRLFQTSKPWSHDAAPAPFGVVTLSATPTQLEQAPALLRKDDRKHPVLGPRLAAKKPAQIVSTSDEAGSKAWVAECVERAWALSVPGGGNGKTIAVVVNRIARARAIHEALKDKVGDPPAADLALLIGRTRPLERDRRIDELLPRLAATRKMAPNAGTLFVIATQCIEAGADFDFDGMVTELAPLDCLRQRFGRVNRTGRAIESRGVVIASAEQIGARAKPDPIYEEKLATTWELLSTRATKRVKGKHNTQWIEFGVDDSRAWLPTKDLDRYVAPREAAPILMPAFVEQWMNTSPIPTADPDVSLFLHGPKAGPSDVQVVWRADLPEADQSIWRDRVAVCPPSALEAISVPFPAARAWLASGRQEEIADVELGIHPDPRTKTGGGRRALRWRGPDDDTTAAIWPDRIRPGDVLVVPSGYGGCDQWGWAPRDRRPVQDLGAEANRQHRGLDVLRLNREIAAQTWREDVPGADGLAAANRFAGLLATIGEESDRELVHTLASAGSVPPSWREKLRPGKGKLHRNDQGNPIAFVGRVLPGEPTGIASTEDDLGSRSVKSVTLGEHSRGVHEVARRFSQQLGLPPAVASDLALAALLHDAGKAHPDFKCWLYDGDELAASAGPDLAKSGHSLGPRSRKKAGLPPGARHEIASLSFALSHAAFRDARDPELVLWLIGTHHGKGRPFFPAVEWPRPDSTFLTDLGTGAVRSEGAPRLAALLSRWCDMQSRLTRKYGPWGLARLEAVLRLADHRRSEAEEVM